MWEVPNLNNSSSQFMLIHCIRGLGAAGYRPHLPHIQDPVQQYTTVVPIALQQLFNMPNLLQCKSLFNNKLQHNRHNNNSNNNSSNNSFHNASS